MPFHLAIFAALTPPAVENEPPTYTLPPLIAIAYTVPLTPKLGVLPSPLQYLPFQWAMLLTVLSSAFSKLPPALKRHLLRVAIENILGSLKDIETRHIEEIMDVLERPAGKQVSLPGGLVFYIEYNRYLLGMASVKTCPYPVIGGQYNINIPGETELPGWRVEAEIIEPSEKGEGLVDNDFTACLDLEKTGGDLKVRPRKPGDRLQPLGMTETKKLNEFMIDSKIPRSWRGRIPVVLSPQQIVWLVGYRIDDRVKVTQDTKQVLRLHFRRC